MMSIQNDLPLEVLDASTTGTSEIIVHSHRQPNQQACLSCIYPHIPDELARARDIAAGLGLELAVVIANERIDARVAGILAAKHVGLNEAALVGKTFDSLFKELCAEQALLTATGEQVLAPSFFVSNLAGALLALELAASSPESDLKTARTLCSSVLGRRHIRNCGARDRASLRANFVPVQRATRPSHLCGLN